MGLCVPMDIDSELVSSGQVDLTQATFVGLNHPGVSGDFNPWEGWSHARKHIEEVPGRVECSDGADVSRDQRRPLLGYPAMTQGAHLLGITTAETVRKWERQDEVDHGQRAGVTSEESAEVKRFEKGERRVAAGELDPESRVGFFAAELDRPAQS